MVGSFASEVHAMEANGRLLNNSFQRILVKLKNRDKKLSTHMQNVAVLFCGFVHLH